MHKISMIMPAYNAQATCRAAIESVLRQNGLDWELIIVDDGSTDSTLEICSEYQRYYPNIRVYSQKNSGVSSARNTALELAEGDYIGFIDADDRLADSFSDKIRAALEKGNPSMVLFGYSYMDQNGRIGGWRPQRNGSFKEIVYELLNHSGGMNPPWNKLYRKEIIRRPFNVHKAMGEDLEFVCDCLENTDTIAVLSEELYLYRIDSTGSLTKKLDIVLPSITADMNVLVGFTSAVHIGEALVKDKFYQRTEGILGSLENYQNFKRALEDLIDNAEYAGMIQTYLPNKKKNQFLRALMVKRRKRLLYGYLYLKRVARKMLK